MIQRYSIFLLVLTVFLLSYPVLAMADDTPTPSAENTMIVKKNLSEKRDAIAQAIAMVGQIFRIQQLNVQKKQLQRKDTYYTACNDMNKLLNDIDKIFTASSPFNGTGDYLAALTNAITEKILNIVSIKACDISNAVAKTVSSCFNVGDIFLDLGTLNLNLPGLDGSCPFGPSGVLSISDITISPDFSNGFDIKTQGSAALFGQGYDFGSQQAIKNNLNENVKNWLEEIETRFDNTEYISPSGNSVRTSIDPTSDAFLDVQ